MARSNKPKDRDSGNVRQNQPVQPSQPVQPRFSNPPSPNHPQSGQSQVFLLPKGFSRAKYEQSIQAARKRLGLK